MYITVFVTTRWLPIMDQKLLTLPEHPSSSPVFCGIRVIHVVKLHFFTCLFPCFDVRYDFHLKRYQFRLYSHIYCRVHSLSMLFVFITHTGVQRDSYIIRCLYVNVSKCQCIYVYMSIYVVNLGKLDRITHYIRTQELLLPYTPVDPYDVRIVQL